MGSLYRRYPSKEMLAQRMRVVGMEQLATQARTALAEEPDPWAAFARFLRNALLGPGGRRLQLLPLVGGRLPATEEIVAAAARLRAALDDLVDGAHRTGVLRADFASADVPRARTPHRADPRHQSNAPPRSTCGTLDRSSRDCARSPPTGPPRCRAPLRTGRNWRELWNAPRK